jgi:predicted TPR repeat methyltransferase
MKNGCVVCGSTHYKPLYTGIIKCGKCGHVFSDLDLSNKELFELYSKNYFCGEEYSDYLADKKVLQKNFKLRLKVLKTFLNPIRHRHLLEIGSAYGFFLSIVSDQFDTVLGIDVTEEGVLYAQEQLKLKVINSDLLKHDFGVQEFDVVCMWDTIEHLQNPHLYLKKISNHMGSGSLIAITTGDVESLNARISKDKWRLIHPPTHIHYFSRRTLVRLLDNYGFDVVYNRYCGFYRSTDMVAYRTLVLSKGWSRLYNFLCKSRLTSIDFYLNLYDIMYVIAIKR